MARAGSVARRAGRGLGRDPATGPGPWPWGLILALALAGLISPAICLIAAVAAYGLADPEQGTLLAAAALVHTLIGLTFLGG